MARMLGALLIVAAMFVAGCTAVDGTASAAGPTGIALPPRPRDVRIDGVDPCSLLTAGQRAELGLDGPPSLSSAPSALYNGGEVRLCAIRGFEPRAITIGLGIVTTAGIELFASGDVAAIVRPVEVATYPAILAIPTRFVEHCSVLVDVAPGQLLDVQFRDGGRQPYIPQEQLCRGAEQAARAAMTTLLATG